MSLHSTLVAGAGLGQLLRTQGEAVTYIDAEARETPLTALVGDRKTVRKENQPGGATFDHTRTFLFTRDPASPYGGIAAPRKNAQIEYADELYAILGIESQSASQTMVNAGYCGQATLEGRGTRGRT